MSRDTNNFNETAFCEIECLSKSMGVFLRLIIDDLGHGDNDLAYKIYGIFELNKNIIHQCHEVSTSIINNNQIKK